jgi:uncharacterized membrane protein
VAILILGLALFLGTHSVRIVADGWRAGWVARLGPERWKGLYSVLSLVGFVLLAWGFSRARGTAAEVWWPPIWGRHLASLLVLAGLVLVVAAYVPGNQIRAVVHHPMVLGTQLWALGHLLSNGSTADVVLFGSFLAWAVLSFLAARRRDRRENTAYPPGRPARTAVVVGVGAALWAALAFFLHVRLFGVAPLG